MQISWQRFFLLFPGITSEFISKPTLQVCQNVMVCSWINLPLNVVWKQFLSYVIAKGWKSNSIYHDCRCRGFQRSECQEWVKKIQDSSWDALQLFNYNCNIRSKANWSLSAMYFNYTLKTTKEVRPSFLRADVLTTSYAKNVFW